MRDRRWYQATSRHASSALSRSRTACGLLVAYHWPPLHPLCALARRLSIQTRGAYPTHCKYAVNTHTSHRVPPLVKPHRNGPQNGRFGLCTTYPHFPPLRMLSLVACRCKCALATRKRTSARRLSIQMRFSYT